MNKLISVAFEVTERNIQLGVRQDCSFCPVAIAINKELDDSVQAFAMKNVLILQNKFNKEFIYSVAWPVEVASFVEDFDTNKQVNPFKFKLDIPEKLLSVSARRVK